MNDKVIPIVYSIPALFNTYYIFKIKKGFNDFKVILYENIIHKFDIKIKFIKPLKLLLQNVFYLFLLKKFYNFWNFKKSLIYLLKIIFFSKFSYNY